MAAAVRFLGNEKVVGRPPSEKEDFLVNKGLTREEIAEAVRRYEGRGDAGAAAASPAAGQGVAAAPPAGVEPAPCTSWPAVCGGCGPAMPPMYGPAMYGAAPAHAAGGSAVQAAPREAGPAWPWALGGLCAGAALTAGVSALWRGGSSGHPQAGDGAPPSLHLAPPGMLPVGDVGHAAWLPGPAAAGGKPAPVVGELVPVTSDAPSPAASAGADGSASPPAAAVAAIERTAVLDKETRNELLSALRQHSDESKETSAFFRRCMQQQQDQLQKVVDEMEKLLQAQTQHQKAQKGQPLEISAASLQTLVSLMQPPVAQPPQEAVTDRADGSSYAKPPTAATGDIRESFASINFSLQRIVNESASKDEAGKALSKLTMLLQNLLNSQQVQQDQPALQRSNTDRYTKINTSNARFRDLLDPRGAPAELLRLAGFKFEDPNFTFAAEQGTASAQRVRDLIVDTQGKLDQLWNTRSPVENGGGLAAPSSTNGESLDPSDEGRAGPCGGSSPPPAQPTLVGGAPSLAAATSVAATAPVAAALPAGAGAPVAALPLAAVPTAVAATPAVATAPGVAAAAGLAAMPGAMAPAAAAPAGACAAGAPLPPAPAASQAAPARPWQVASRQVARPATQPHQGFVAVDSEHQAEEHGAFGAGMVPAPAAGGALASSHHAAAPAMAHPAESVPAVPAAPAPTLPADAGGSQMVATTAVMQHPVVGNAAAPQPPPAAAAAVHLPVPAAAVPAHPAEGSVTSGEPNSGG